MAGKNRFSSPGGWIQKSDNDGLALRVRDFLVRHTDRAQTAFVAQTLGVDRAAAYAALTQLHADRMVGRRPDARGRVWWFPRTDVDLKRKERIVFALERAAGGELPTSRLGRAWGETDVDRAYAVLRYYRELGLLESTPDLALGKDAVWKIKR